MHCWGSHLIFWTRSVVGREPIARRLACQREGALQKGSLGGFRRYSISLEIDRSNSRLRLSPGPAFFMVGVIS